MGFINHIPPVRCLPLRSLAGMGAMLLCLAGCHSAGSAAVGTVGHVVNKVVGPSVDLVSGAVNTVTPTRQEDLKERQRIAMAMRAGPGKFQNPALAEYRDRLRLRNHRVSSTPFDQHKLAMSSPSMAHFRRQVNNGTVPVDPLPEAVTNRGSIKGQMGLPLINVMVRQLGAPSPVGLPALLPAFSE